MIADLEQSWRTTLPSYRIAGVSARGSRHRATGEPCQDSHLITKLPNGTAVVAVADGAGSAVFGAVGATIATHIALRQLEQACLDSDTLDSDVLQEALHSAAIAARDAISAAAHAGGDPVEQFSTTLILCVVSEGVLAAWQIGDGAVVADLGDEGIISVTKPLLGEHPNETVFLTAPDYRDHVQCVTRRKIVRAAAIFTDGLQRLAMNMATCSPHLPFFRPLFDALTTPAIDQGHDVELEQFLKSPAVVSRTDDDATLVLVVNDDRVATTASLPRESGVTRPESSANQEDSPNSVPLGAFEPPSPSESRSDIDMTRQVRRAYQILEERTPSSPLPAKRAHGEESEPELDDDVPNPQPHGRISTMPLERRSSSLMIDRLFLAARILLWGGRK